MSIKKELIDHPSYYTWIKKIECISVVENFSFNTGNAIKYIWRAGKKRNTEEDLTKAIWYLQREIRRIRNEGRAN